MASFSATFPRAVHVLPLHALGGILEDRAFLANSTLPHRLHRTNAAVRKTSSQTDAALGLGDYVHLYLLHSNSPWENIPILAAQLLNGRGAPFPHVAIEIGTEGLSDDECKLCIWNVAVSRPKVNNLCKGGNWTRGTEAARVLQIWRSFKHQGPDVRMARGYWNHPIQIPTLRGDQIGFQLSLLGRAPGGMPELLLRSPVKIDNRYTLWAFSPEDMEALRSLREVLQVMIVEGDARTIDLSLSIPSGFARSIRQGCAPAWHLDCRVPKTRTPAGSNCICRGQAATRFWLATQSEYGPDRGSAC
ncbi:MAG: hypothetical protein JWO80_4930 [Bryobacterales bacterium]|nr:hypothetical protein [Bryobacterales bacterium]